MDGVRIATIAAFIMLICLMCRNDSKPASWNAEATYSAAEWPWSDGNSLQHWGYLQSDTILHFHSV